MSYMEIMEKTGLFPRSGEYFRMSERKLEHMDDIIQDDGTILHRERRNLFTHDQKILVTTHWDSHFSMICGDSQTLNRIVESADLEGFFCDEGTEIYWSIKNGAPLRRNT